MIPPGGRWLSVILVCLVTGCQQAHVASGPPGGLAPAGQPIGSASTASSGSGTAAPTGPTIMAFSLRAAERVLGRSEPSPMDASTLAGMTRPLGLVYDPGAQDLIIVGQAGDGDPLQLDDLVVMMRTVLEQGTWPLCSIDRTAETPFTGMQIIRFEGIENTSLGADCFSADTILKLLALGQITADDLDIPSYFDLLLDDIEADGSPASISSRLWGYPMQPSLIRRENTFAIRDLKIGVQAEAIVDPTSQSEPLRDAIAEEFAKQLTQNYDRLALQYPELGRMAVMFRLAALAYGMRTLEGSPDLRYWLHDYELPLVETETEYPTLRRSELLDVDGETLTVQVEGGIGMDGGTLRLEDGDLSVLREAVLRSRPDQGALAWRIPLNDGWFDSDATRDGSEAGNGPARSLTADRGTYLTRRVEVVARPAPGGPPAVWSNPQGAGVGRAMPNQQPSARVEQAAREQSPAPPPQVLAPQVPQPQIQQPPQLQQPRGQQPWIQQPPPMPVPPAPQPRVQQPPAQQPQVRQSAAQQPPIQQVEQTQVQQPQPRPAPTPRPPAPQPPAQQASDQQVHEQRTQQSQSNQADSHRPKQSRGRNDR